MGNVPPPPGHQGAPGVKNSKQETGQTVLTITKVLTKIIIIIIIRNLYSAIMPLGGYRGADD